VTRRRLLSNGSADVAATSLSRDEAGTRAAFPATGEGRRRLALPPAVERWLRTPGSAFWVFLLAYSVTWGGHYTSGDGAQKVAWAKAMLWRGSADIDPGPGVAHSIYGIGHSLLAIPPLALAELARRATGVPMESLFYTFLFVANGAFFLYLAARYLHAHYSARQTWATLAVLGFATVWWPYTKLDFSEPLVLTFLFGGFLLAREGRSALGVAVASFAVLVRPDAAVPVALLALWQLWRTRDRRLVVPMLLAALPALALHLAANWVRWGSLGEGGYAGHAFSNPPWVGLYGILFSAGKSVFLFTPPLVLGFAALGRFLKTPHGRRDGVFFLAVFAAQLVTYAAWWDWSGDDAWGVRFLVPGVMLMTIPVVELLGRRRLVAAVAGAGVCVQLLGVLVSGLDYVMLVHLHDLRRSALYVDGGRNRVDVEDMRYNPRYGQLAGHFLLVRTLAGLPPRAAASPLEEARTGTPLSAMLTPEEWKRAARWDFVWLLALERSRGPGGAGRAAPGAAAEARP
jgi:hypothetical protein